MHLDSYVSCFRMNVFNIFQIFLTFLYFVLHLCIEFSVFNVIFVETLYLDTSVSFMFLLSFSIFNEHFLSYSAMNESKQ